MVGRRRVSILRSVSETDFPARWRHHSSTPRKRPAPKSGEAPKPAPTQEEIDEWLSPLNECIKEVKELVRRQSRSTPGRRESKS